MLRIILAGFVPLDRPERKLRPLLSGGTMPRRVIVYVDGFNLYHAVDNLNRPHLKWVDLRALAAGLLRHGEVLKTVKYFSAYATWIPTARARHELYVAALRSRGVEIHMGQFKQKPRKCRHCGTRWMGHEEKETDVQIATHMVCDALLGEVDRIILISADTDLSPPIKAIAAQKPQVEVFVAPPPGRLRICRALGPKLEIRRSRLEASLLPQSIQTGPGRFVTRPSSYDPPI